MKKLIAVGLFLNLAFLAVRAWQGRPAEAGGGPATDERFCADVNGDGTVDISDALKVLNYLFGGGPAPYCVAQGVSIDRLTAEITELKLQLAECEETNNPVQIDWVTVGDPGNAPDDTGFGAVSETYRIAKYEVTNSQWAEFLNAVDPEGRNKLELYSELIDPEGGIEFVTGNADGCKYVVKKGRGNKPAIRVNWYDAARFCNWIHNSQGGPGSTEDGAYDMDADPIVRKDGAKVFLPSVDEWYKAAYYDPATGTYFDYATQSNSEPTAEPPPGGSNSQNAEGAVADVTDVGAYVNAPSPYSTFDQCGNVLEWIEDEGESGSRGVRGGSWALDNSDCRAAYHFFTVAGDRSVINGFRPAGRVP